VSAAGFVMILVAALAQAPNAEQLFRKGLALRDKGAKAEALENFRRAAGLDPAVPHLQQEIGVILLEQRDFTGAAIAFRHAVRQNPKDFEARYNLALSLANAGSRKEGIEELRQVLRQKPDWGQAFFGLGHIYVLEKQTGRAEQAFRTAVSLDPKLSRAHFELGKLLDEKGDDEGAIEAFQAVVRLDPNAASARYRLGVLLRQAGKAAEASQQFSAARHIREDRYKGEQAAAAFRQGLAMLERSNWESAVLELQKASELRPDFEDTRPALAEAHERWGLELEHKGQIPAALEHFKQALSLDPTAQVRNHIGVLLAKSGDLDGAIENFRGALALDPEFPNAQTNLQQALELRTRRER